MITIEFDIDHRVRQGDGKGEHYRKGERHTFSGPVAESYARKYLARGYAHEIGHEPATLDAARAELAARDAAEADRKARDARKLADRTAVAIPDDLEALTWAELRTLAAQLTDDPVHSKAAAHAAIEAERGRRAIAG